MAVQEAQLAGGAISVPGYQVAVVSRRALGKRDGGTQSLDEMDFSLGKTEIK